MDEYVIWNKEKNKIVYRILEKKENEVVLVGLNYRKIVLAKVSELEGAETYFVAEEYNKREMYEKYIERNLLKNKKTGTILHFDSDFNYLTKCVELYSKVGIYCYPVLCDEEDISVKIDTINFIPDIVVVTGHDFYNSGDPKDITSYTNSVYFVDAVKKIKKRYPNAVVIAGACQSNFEALVANGADFASSPKRKNVHIYDPAVIAIAVGTTSFRKVVDFNKLEKYIEGFKESYSGLETYGKMRILY